MILYLFLSIISSTFLFVLLKSFSRWKVDTMHGIIFNYWTAALLSFLFNIEGNMQHFGELKSLWHVSFGIGFMFITVFFIMALTTQKSGVAVASVASKMSMVIPISAGLVLYNESLDLLKISGILLSIPAVIITSYPSGSLINKTRFSYRDLMLPLILFFGAGLVDTAIKASQHYYMNDDNRQLIIMSIFASAGIFGIVRLLYEVFVTKKRVLLRSVFGGILLGITNYFSLYFLLICLESPGSESSTIFAFVNVGVVIASFFAGLLLFREKPTRNKIFGILLALVAIITLSIQQS